MESTFEEGKKAIHFKSHAQGVIYFERWEQIESLNLREGQPRPGTGFGLSPLFCGKEWTHFALFSFKIWE